MEKGNDIFQNIKISVEENKLSVHEQYMLYKLLGEKLDGQDKCLAIVIDEEIRKNESTKKYMELYSHILNLCFWETETGCTKAEKLSAKAVRAFISKVRDSFGLKEIEELVFMQLLALGLKKMEDDGLLKFVPDGRMFRRYIASKRDISYIQNPYTEEETEKIMEWSNTHPADVRAYAVSLWFTKGLTLTDIATLTKKDCWGDKRQEGRIERAGIALFQHTVRAQIVWRALNTHPKDVQYVFAIPNADYSGWEKLTERGLQVKLKAICEKTGVQYKPILTNEAIRLK